LKAQFIADSPQLSEYVCEGAGSFEVEIDADANRRLIDIEGRLSTDTSKIGTWVTPTEEVMQMITSEVERYSHRCSRGILRYLAR